MLPVASQCSFVLHEVVEAFKSIGFPLNPVLASMLNEAPEHQKPRRGCGFTQASRFLANLINQPRCLSRGGDLQLFSEAGRQRFKKMLAVGRSSFGGLPNGIVELRKLLESQQGINPQTEGYIAQLRKMENLPGQLALEESRLIANLILSILGRRPDSFNVATLAVCKEKLAIGTCPEAERYFLEFSGGYLRRQGIINILTDEFEQPLLIEKIKIGDSHSCITVKELRLNNVLIPAGSLLGTRYSSIPINAKPCSEIQGVWMPASNCDGFRFLRLTTLSVSPQNRARAFNNHLKRQLEGSPFFDPLNTRLSDLSRAAFQQNPLQ